MGSILHSHKKEVPRAKGPLRRYTVEDYNASESNCKLRAHSDFPEVHCEQHVPLEGNVFRPMTSYVTQLESGMSRSSRRESSVELVDMKAPQLYRLFEKKSFQSTHKDD